MSPAASGTVQALQQNNNNNNNNTTSLSGISACNIPEYIVFDVENRQKILDMFPEFRNGLNTGEEVDRSTSYGAAHNGHSKKPLLTKQILDVILDRGELQRDDPTGARSTGVPTMTKLKRPTLMSRIITGGSSNDLLSASSLKSASRDSLSGVDAEFQQSARPRKPVVHSNAVIDECHNTLLHLAVANNDEQLIACLLLKGANPSLANRAGYTAVSMAKLMKCSDKIMTMLTKHSCDNGFKQIPYSYSDNTVAVFETISNDNPANVQMITAATRDLKYPKKYLATFNHDFYNAAYCNNLKNIPQTVIDSGKLNDRDLYGSTALMKAAFQNHKSIVKRLLDKGVDTRIQDQRGYTALIWACLGGSMESFQLIYDVVSKRRDSSNNTSKMFTQSGYNAVRKVHQSQINNIFDRQALALDALMAAVLGGNVALVKLIIEILQQGESQISESTPHNAFSLALIEARVDIILLLFRNGFCDHERWFSSLDDNSWLYRTLLRCEFCIDRHVGEILEKKFNELPDGTIPSSSALTLLSKILPEETLISGVFKEPFWQPVLNSWGSRLACNEILFAHADLLRTPSLATVDRILGQHFDHKDSLSYRSLLTQQFQPAGTHLNQILMGICKTIIDLKAAIVTNSKAQYVLITTRTLNAADEILKKVENCVAGQRSLMNASLLMKHIFDLCAKLKNQETRNLLQATRLAVGAWPPPDAAENMFHSSIKLVESCSKLILLANSSGRWPLGHIDLEQFYYSTISVQVEPAHNERSSLSKRTTVTPSPISYDDYQKQYENKLLTQISYINTPNSGLTKTPIIAAHDASSENPPAENLSKSLKVNFIPPEIHVEDRKFFDNIDNHVKLFVQAVQSLKQASAQDQKQSFATIAASIYARIDALVQDVSQYYLFKTLEDTFTLGPAEYTVEQQLTLKDSDDCYLTYWKRITKFRELLLRNADNIILKSKLAAGVWPPPEAVQDMVKSTIPCVVGLKQLGDYLKKVCYQVRLTDNAERTKLEIFMREWEQSARVRQVFDELERMKRKKPNTNAVEDIEQDQNSEDLSTYEDILEDQGPNGKDSGLILDTKDGKITIKAGRLAKLVQKLTDYKFVEPEFRTSFLLTHHSFTTSLEFLDLLIKRYDIIPPYGMDKRSFEIYVNKKVIPVRLRVYNIIKLWLLKYPQDFIQNTELSKQTISRMWEFVQNRLLPDFGETSNQQVITLLNKLKNHLEGNKTEADWWQNDTRQNMIKPLVNVPKLALSKGYSVEDLGTKLPALDSNNLPAVGLWEFVDPIEFARQITLIDYDLFKEIKPSEFLNQNWEKQATRLQKSPNICKMIQNTNDLTSWVTLSVISISDDKLRTSVIKFMVQTAQACFELNNFNAVTAFVAGLGMGPARRMTKTWIAFEDRHPRSREILDDLTEVVSAKGQYSQYRTILKSKTAPIVPFLGVFLTDLSFVELGNSDYIPELNYINFEKRRKVAFIISEIQQYQLSAYNLTPVEPVKVFIKTIALKYGPWLEERQMYQRSLESEPREPETVTDST